MFFKCVFIFIVEIFYCKIIKVFFKINFCLDFGGISILENLKMSIVFLLLNIKKKYLELKFIINVLNLFENFF